MAERSVVFVYDSRISGLFSRGGDASKHVTSFLRQTYYRAVATAPVRSGDVKRSHGRSGVLKRGRFHAEGSVYNTSKHAPFVHEGVPGRIFPKSGEFLVFRSRTGTVIRRRSVRGQRANPWIADAAKKTMRRF